MGKKTVFLIAVLVSIASLYADSFRFSIVWDKVIESETNLCVVNLDDTNEVENHTKALEIISSVQDIARVQYSSNEGGIHVLSYKATPLMNDADSAGHSFNLFFRYTENGTTDVQEIQVGTNKNLSYPNGSVVAATSINMGHGGTLAPRYVLIQVELPESSMDTMQTGITYSSTITIERTSP